MLNKKEIAEAFSIGDFEKTYNYLADDVEWNIVGEKLLSDKKQVIENCEKTSNYFKSVTTVFKTQNVIVDNKLVAINGTADFFREDKRIAYVLSCDVYEFNEVNKLQKITSYCITQHD